MANPFKNLPKVEPGTVKKSMQWYRAQVYKLGDVSRGVNRSLATGDSRIKMGGLYLFKYDPKWKDVLPYYDTLPLVFPFDKAEGGFLGLNLHYLHPTIRARFLDKLMETTNNDKYDETTKFKINYNILNNAKRYKEFEPCVKRYLYSHLRSRVMEIPSDDWEIALFLPTEKFVKASAIKVQRDSIRSII